MDKIVDKSDSNEDNDKYKVSDITEMLEPVHSTVRELIDVEAGGGFKGTYTDSDVVAATLLYTLVMGNRLLRQLEAEKAGITLAHNISSHYQSLIQETTKGMSGLDVSTFYKKSDRR